jgi:hypothetical protein
LRRARRSIRQRWNVVEKKRDDLAGGCQESRRFGVAKRYWERDVLRERRKHYTDNQNNRFFKEISSYVSDGSDLSDARGSSLECERYVKKMIEKIMISQLPVNQALGCAGRS